MNFSATFKRSRTKQSSFTTDKRLVISSIPPPLYIPEILSVVLSFIPQHTLFHSAQYVCKQWHALARPWIQTHGVWKDFDAGKHNREILIPHLHLVTDLCVRFGRGWYYEGTRKLWTELSDKIDSINSVNQLKITRLAIVHVTHLIPMVYPILSKMRALTDIHLAEVSSPEIHLGSILELCPKLRRLHIDNESCTGDHRIMDRTLSQQETAVMTTRSGIESIIIRGMKIEQTIMEGILQRCARLQHLKLNQILIAEQHHHQQPQQPQQQQQQQQQLTQLQFDQAKFFKTVARLCPLLKSFHFSFYNQHTSSENANFLVQAFFPKQSLPAISSEEERMTTITNNDEVVIHQQMNRSKMNLDTIRVLDRDIDRLTSHIFLAPILLNSSYDNVITTLEIMPSIEQSHYDCVIHALHNVLCSAPSLLHLIAPTVPYFAEYFDLSDSSSAAVEGSFPLWNCTSRCPASEISFTEKKIWACRGLQTLQLRFISKLKPDEASPENSRKMFGYISRVCPNLRELAIYRWELNLKLEGGLCLLSRLKFLKKLTVMSWSKTKLKKQDLDWMTRYPPRKLNPGIRYWRKMTRISSGNKSSDTDTSDSECNNNARSRSCSNLDIKDMDLVPTRLGDIGSLEDLEACRKEILQSASGDGCWPLLEFLGLRHSDVKHCGPGRYLPAMVSKILPGVEFSCSYSRLLNKLS